MWNDTNETSPELSAAGRRRREEILALATRQASVLRRRRAMRRVSGAAAVLLGATVVALIVRNSEFNRPAPIADPSPVTQPIPTQVAVTPVAPRPSVVTTAPASRPSRSAVVIQTIRTDPTLVDRLAVPRQIGGWETIGTDELLGELKAVGLAGGVVVRDGRSTVWFKPEARN